MKEIDDLLRMSEILNRLSDDESIVVMNAKFMIYKDYLRFWQTIKQLNHDWRIDGFDDEGYIVFQAGNRGRQCADVMQLCNKRIAAFIDNDSAKWGQTIEGIPVMSVDEVKKMPDCKIISGNPTYADSLRRQLKEIGASNEVIDGFCAFTGKQYFDVLKPDRDEVFIDAGAYDGGTILDFIDWTGTNGYDKVYSFEPDTLNELKAKECIETNGLKNIEFIAKGTWFEDAELYFNNNGSSGSSVIAQGLNGTKVQLTSIDNVMQGRRVSYIKMDVEGSEMETLEGAENTIRKWKPKLAVCVYHKPFDIVELPLKIIGLNPDYRFYLRHYASNMCETVLYAE